MTKEHFHTLYDNAPFDHFVYDSRRLGKVRQFATSNQIQIMVINIQSFQKDVADKDLSEMTEDELKKLNVINRENDRMSGRRPIEFIQAASPIVIIDEPQSVDTTEKSRRAIGNLNPMATLRYSATHRNPYNLLYKLDPIKAYDLRLVKRIEVASIRSDNNFNDAYVKLLKTDNKNGIKAQVEIHKEGAAGPKPTKLWVKQGDDLYRRSDERDVYRDGYIVQNIDCTPGSEYIEFNQGRFLELGQEVGGLGDDIMKAQVYETVEQHLKKERALKGKGIKVLSLFFIDRVANYRIYNEDGTTSLGKIGQWFEEAYKELTAKPIYKGLIPFGVADVHNGYFSQDKQGHAKDTRGNTADDDDTYSLIMRDKERLLDPNVALRFIFSHSALREGWDNPNVFQICTLNESMSVERKRQEIGRGLRLPVNETGERVHDETINRLTVIANESYEDFARTLQTEFEEDFGIKFGRVDKIAFAKLVRRAKDGTDVELGQDTSTKIWNELVASGYLNAAGDILEKFDPRNPHFKLEISSAFADLRAEITDEVNRKLFKNRIVNVRDERTLKFRKEVHLSADFQALWDTIKHRTRYRVIFETPDLIERALARIKQIEPIKAARVATTVVEVDITDAGVSADRQISARTRDVEQVKVLPDILAFLQKETELTRHTLAEILKRSGRLGEFKINPQAFMAAVSKEISRALHDLMLEGIKYEKVAGQHWEMSRIEQDAEDGIVRYLGNLYEVQNREKSLFDGIVYESEVEKQFARDLDSNENVNSAEIRENQLVFAARGRAVKREKLARYVPGLERKIENDDGSLAAYYGFVEGPRLDAMVRTDRFGFEIDEDEDDLFEGSKSLSAIRGGALEAVREELSVFLGKMREQKEETVSRYVIDQAPEYRRLLKTHGTRVLEVLPANPKPKDIDAALGRVWVERQSDLKEEGRALLAFKPGSDTMEDYQTQMDGFFKNFEDLDQTALANYVVHRRIVINLLEKALERDDDTGRYQLEAVVHRLIHPMRQGSDEVEFEEQNLWILDDRLTYHDFMESDKELRASDRLENDSATRPDLLAVFDRTLTFREGRDPSTSFVIVEFKKPDRRSFERSPLSQVYDQVRDIRAGKFKDRKGRPVEGTSKDAPAFCYVVCDVTPNVEKGAVDAGGQLTPDGRGYFGWNSQLKLYFEIISYEKLVGDALRRNRMLFKKLGLPTDRSEDD